MKLKFLSLFIALGIFVGAGTAFAQTYTTTRTYQVPTTITTTTTAKNASASLKLGASGVAVSNLQQQLKDHGYSVTVNGTYDYQTVVAVTSFQRANVGLVADGIAGVQTILRLSSPMVKPVPTATASTSLSTFPTVNSGLVTTGGSTPCTYNTAPWIKVISPNGGETYTAGQQILVKWQSCNIPANTLMQVLVGEVYTSGSIGWLSNSLLTTINSGNGTITLPTTATWLGSPSMIYGTHFKVQVVNNNGISDLSDSLFTINGSQITSGLNLPPAPNVGTLGVQTGVSGSCNSQIKIALVPEETSPDGIDGSITSTDQEIARFWLYSPCNVSINGLSTQPFGGYSVSNGQGGNVGYTFWGANRFSKFTAREGFDMGPILGSVNYNGSGSSSSIQFSQPLHLNAGIPKAISISGKLKSVNQVSGIVLDRGQFCIEKPTGVVNSNGSAINLLQMQSSNGTSGNFIGRFTCGDIFSIN